MRRAMAATSWPSTSRRQGAKPPKPWRAMASMTASSGWVKPSVAVLMAHSSGWSLRSRILDPVERQELAHAPDGTLRIADQPRLVGKPQNAGEIGDRPHRLGAARHDEMLLEAVEPSKEDDARLVILRRRPEDQARQGNGRGEELGIGLPVAACEFLECQRCRGRDRIEYAEKRMRIALRVASDQIGIVEVIARIHLHA